MTVYSQNRPGGGTPERHTETYNQEQHSTTRPACQVKILDLIPAGPTNAISMRRLTRMTGANGREIRRRIAAERAAGAVILTGQGGYYTPSDNGQRGRDEVTEWLSRITAKGVSTLRAGDSARKWLSVLPGQQRIGGGDRGEE